MQTFPWLHYPALRAHLEPSPAFWSCLASRGPCSLSQVSLWGEQKVIDMNNGGWAVGFPSPQEAIRNLFMEIKTKPLSQRGLMFWGKISERINILFFLLWLQSPTKLCTWQSKQFSLCSWMCSECSSVSKRNAYKCLLTSPRIYNTA